MLLVASDQIVRPALDSRNKDRKIFIHYHTAIFFQFYLRGQRDDLKFQSGHEILKNRAHSGELSCDRSYDFFEIILTGGSVHKRQVMA